MVGSTVNGAHSDGINQQYSILGVIGTLGTTDIGGTAKTLPIGVNSDTGALYVQDLSGASGTTNIQGSVQITGGTINAGTFTSISPQSTISTNNSTASVLGVGAVFTGNSEDVTTYSEMRCSVIASQASASDGLVFQQSSDGTNWDITDTYTIVANTGKTFVVPRQAKFFRIVYTNGGTIQGSFRLQTILNRTATSASSQRASDAYTNETDLEQSWAFNSVYNGATWDRLKGTSGTLFTAIAAGTMQIAGTVSGGTIQNLVSGTLGAVTTVSNLTNGSVNILTGTLQSSGTTTGVGVVSALTNGSVNILTGTVTAVTTVSNLTNGSVNILTGTLQSSGTTTGVGVVTALTNGSVNVLTGTIQAVTTVSNLTNGSINILTGTVTAVTTVTNLTNGSVNLLTGTVTRTSNIGTLESGTVKINATPAQIGTSFVTNGTTATAVWGTIITASGAGTKQYVSGVAIVVTSGTVDVAVTNIGVVGSTGAGVLARGQFPAGGGIQRQFNPVSSSGTNGTISYWLGGAGTVNITVDYWQGV